MLYIIYAINKYICLMEGDATVKMKRTLVFQASRLFLGLGFIGIIALAALIGTQRYSALAQSPPSYVRVIHASPFVGTADVFVDGTKLLSSFQFGAVTDYVAVPAGPHKVQIALVGKGIGASVISETLAVSPGVVYTVAATGATPSSLSLQVFIDSNLLTPGTAQLRVYHLSPDAGSVSMDAGGKTLVSGIDYLSASNYLSIPAGTYTLGVDSSTNSASLHVSATLKANTVTSVFAVGLVQGSPNIQLVTAQVPGLPGVPNTGSDPNALSQEDNVQPLASWTWLVGCMSLLLIGSGIFIRRLLAKRQSGI
jgi:uncharacterized protein DUF4397